MRISDWSSDVCSSDLHIAVHDVAADEPELAFEPFGRQARLGNDARAEAGGVFFDGVDDAVGGGFLFVIPVPPVRQFGRELLAEEARDMLPRRREAVVDGRGDQHLDGRRLRPDEMIRVEEGAVHIVGGWPEGYPAPDVLAGYGGAGV